MLQRLLTVRSLVIALLFSVVLTLAIGGTQAHVRSTDEQTVRVPHDVDRAPLHITDSPPPVIQCIRAPCPESTMDAPVDDADNEQFPDSPPASELSKPWTMEMPNEAEWDLRQEEVAAVRQQRMAQLERQRQQTAVTTNDLPSLPPSSPLPQPRTYDARDDADMQALADLLVMLDAVEAVESGEGGGELGMVGGGEVVEEVVVVVAGDRWGRSMLIEMHRQIFHADSTPCSHFTAPTNQHSHQQQQQGQFEAVPVIETNEPVDAYIQRMLAQQERQAASDAQAPQRWRLPLAERVIIAVGLLSAVALFAATVLCACVIRNKRRQQRVLFEPPSVQQLGLDVPMLSSSPSMSGQVLQL